MKGGYQIIITLFSQTRTLLENRNTQLEQDIKVLREGKGESATVHKQVYVFTISLPLCSLFSSIFLYIPLYFLIWLYLRSLFLLSSSFLFFVAVALGISFPSPIFMDKTRSPVPHHKSNLVLTQSLALWDIQACENWHHHVQVINSSIR